VFYYSANIINLKAADDMQAPASYTDGHEAEGARKRCLQLIFTTAFHYLKAADDIQAPTRYTDGHEAEGARKLRRSKTHISTLSSLSG
jgi:hypothetical protein